MGASRREDMLAAMAQAVEKARSFTGWSFEELDVRHLDERMPWDYIALAREQAAHARAIVDLGTGGGERLSRIVAGSAARVVATEQWEVNAPVARDRLRPTGASVVRADSLRLPFASGSFELVLDRHEALDPAEVARVLRRGGHVITQQVAHDTWPELLLTRRAVEFPDHFRAYQQGFRDAGLVVEDARTHEERVAFARLQDLAYMMLLTPDMFPDFDPLAELDALLGLEDDLRGPEGIVVTERHYIIRAWKP